MTASASAARPASDLLTGATPRQLARTAGALYLVNIVLGAFAIGLVPSMLFVSDLAKTAHNIQTHETLYRLSLAAHVVVTLTNVPMALLFYELFKVVNRRLALLDVFFTLVATAVETSGIVNGFTPLALLHGTTYTGALSAAQMQALEHLPGDLSSVDYSIYGIFYGFDILCVAYLVRRSTFMPKFISILLAIDGLAYLVGGFTNMIAPGVAGHLGPWIQIPAPIGEGALCLWLLIVGVDVERWQQRAAEATATG
ncbi:DUF4386 domain-containing protein [Catenulispora rubra]|uniref:DUF4386 domain-containing protein n=1 Tax=Catenulispora rubra TaxID=280293 RepID=UPI00189253B2|nr:DUF4386 domain-containing protein [Catenulispora rubra]